MVNEDRKIAFKYKVVQEYEVIVYYEQGLSADSVEEAEFQVREDVLDLAYNDEGLVCMTDEDNENSNGYLAFVTTFEPDIEQVWVTKKLPSKIEIALKERGLLK